MLKKQKVDIEEVMRSRMAELNTLVNLVKNASITLSDELKVRYLNRIEEIIAEVNILKIEKVFDEHKNPMENDLVA